MPPLVRSQVIAIEEAMAAGIPQLIMPLAYDQPDNARRLKDLGVGDSLKPARFRGAQLSAEPPWGDLHGWAGRNAAQIKTRLH